MNILIPINNKKEICNLDNKTAFALVNINNGNVKKIEFFETKESIKGGVEYLIVTNKDEEVDEFYDDGVEVLIAPLQKSVDDVMEAFMFRELHDFEG